MPFGGTIQRLGFIETYVSSNATKAHNGLHRQSVHVEPQRRPQLQVTHGATVPIENLQPPSEMIAIS
jgi:hypothetical protein